MKKKIDNKYREEYYDIGGRLIKRINNRNYGRGRWPKIDPPQAGKLVVSIVSSNRGMNVTTYNNCSEEQERDAILMHHGQYDYDEKVDVVVPTSIISTIEKKINSKINNTLSIRSSLASEDMITAVFGNNIQGNYRKNGWNINISFDTYSSNVKEPKNGADLSVIFDIKDSNKNRVIKTILIQSKISNDLHSPIHKLKDLSEQISKMSALTKENYVMIYGEDDFTIFRSSKSNKRTKPSKLFSKIMQCKRGDKSKMVLASCRDSKHVMQFVLSAINERT